MHDFLIWIWCKGVINCPLLYLHPLFIKAWENPANVKKFLYLYRRIIILGIIDFQVIHWFESIIDLQFFPDWQLPWPWNLSWTMKVMYHIGDRTCWIFLTRDVLLMLFVYWLPWRKLTDIYVFLQTETNQLSIAIVER